MATVNQVRKIQNEYRNSTEKMNKNISKAKTATENVQKDLNDLSSELENINVIIEDIDKSFQEKTSIKNSLDMTFLWGAVALQCARWILIPAFDDELMSPNKEGRRDSSIEGKKDKTKSGDYLDRKNRNVINGYPTCTQIIELPVPYDAMVGTEDIVIPGVTDIGKNISGNNHHSATLGHDPILGYIFGTSNILTRSITFHDFKMTTRLVEITGGRSQIVVKTPYGLINMASDVYHSLKEDIKRLPYALLKQVLHMQSDKNTKNGLPIPMIPASAQQMLINNCWNSAELEKLLKNAGENISKQLIVASLINTLIGTLHGFCFNPLRDEDIDLFYVRTRKILATSNAISSSINVTAVLAGTIGGILTENPDMVKKSISHTDIGGYIECIHQVWSSKKIQESIRREFLEKELYKQLLDNKFSYLEG